ncbi:MAG TPA: hypothetical protein VHP33_20270 [Polyangiaceae bacterium]|nr:hypothetical protein [Polyangiaceae bacterium]
MKKSTDLSLHKSAVKCLPNPTHQGIARSSAECFYIGYQVLRAYSRPPYYSWAFTPPWDL